MKKNDFIKECGVENFDSFIAKSNEEYVLFYFNASWCGPCRMIKPILNNLGERFKNKLTIASIDVEENSILAKNFNIFSIPTLFLYKDGDLCNSCSLNKFDLNSINLLEQELSR